MNSNPEEERGEQLIWLRDSAKAVAIQQSNPRGGYNYYCFPDEGTNLDNYPFRDIHNACETLIYFDELMVSVPPEDGPLVFIEPVKDLLVAEKSRQGVGTTDYAILLKFFVDKIADIPSSERRFRGRGAYGAFFLMTEKNIQLLKEILERDPTFFFHALPTLNKGPLKIVKMPDAKIIRSDSLKICPPLKEKENQSEYLYRIRKSFREDTGYNKVKFKFPPSFDPNSLQIIKDW